MTLETFLNFLPIVLFIGIMVFFVYFQSKKNRPMVDAHLAILREKNDILKEMSKSLKEIAEKR